MKHYPSEIHFESFKAGCSQAFNALYKHYYRPIYWTGRTLIKDVFVVETLVQDAFLRLWHKRDDIESPQHLVNFLYAVMNNDCKWFYVRPGNQFQRSLYSFDDYPNYPDYRWGYDPEEVDTHLKEQQNRQKDYEQIITILPLLGNQSKRLIELALEHGFKYKSISEQMGISIKEASNLMKDSIEQIRNILQQGALVVNTNSASENASQPKALTEQEARVLALRCEQQYSFAQIANELKLSQKEVHRAFTTAYQFLQEQHDNQLQSA
ncbi:sigma-70 family RNA polymerase sigma factor [Leeuwenhoekiella parthenopeia]|uniref:Sigma-70 family RNA polymerase sigma factor n=1 Tax=Leeuwenhoekiella parthenopeia TaxID=2890320 RepID=A0ABS8GUS4_9FLAO|nr:sigma-70 family RNA polymerase sigma factor [Leeuwenhoekiella parthenopeia]MCC4212962.1 sigma-70 family RNA polymerase sigma factor [Leeuwenhoekiella parthenopeia]